MNFQALFVKCSFFCWTPPTRIQLENTFLAWNGSNVAGGKNLWAVQVVRRPQLQHRSKDRLYMPCQRCFVRTCGMLPLPWRYWIGCSFHAQKSWHSDNHEPSVLDQPYGVCALCHTFIVHLLQKMVQGYIVIHTSFEVEEKFHVKGFLCEDVGYTAAATQ